MRSKFIRGSNTPFKAVINSASSAAATSGDTVDIPEATAVGDLMLMIVGIESNTSASPTHALPTNWTSLAYCTTADDLIYRVCYKHATASDISTGTVDYGSHSQNSTSCCIVSVRGVTVDAYGIAYEDSDENPTYYPNIRVKTENALTASKNGSICLTFGTQSTAYTVTGFTTLDGYPTGSLVVQKEFIDGWGIVTCIGSQEMDADENTGLVKFTQSTYSSDDTGTFQVMLH